MVCIQAKMPRDIYSCLFIRFGTAEAEDEQMAMGVCAGETLAIGSELAVENGSVTLALDLDEKRTANPPYKNSLARDKPVTKANAPVFIYLLHVSFQYFRCRLCFVNFPRYSAGPEISVFTRLFLLSPTSSRENKQHTMTR